MYLGLQRRASVVLAPDLAKTSVLLAPDLDLDISDLAGEVHSVRITSTSTHMRRNETVPAPLSQLRAASQLLLWSERVPLVASDHVDTI
jgi:hypothetical protein